MTIRLFKFAVPIGLLAALPLAPSSVNASAAAPAPRDASHTHPAALDQAHAFDFLYGKWRVHNHFLVKRLAHSHDWTTFEATDEVRPLPGGIGNEEHYRTNHWKNFVGLGIRLYNPSTQQWTIYWADSHFSAGYFQPPVKGSFINGVGVFTGPDTFDGKPIVVKYTWTDLGDNKARWEQAFSDNGGKTWETNWVMDFTRVASR